MISRGDALPRAGLRRAGSEAVDPIGVALSITAGERSHPRTGTTHYSDPMGVELHADVVRIAGYRPVCGGFSAVTIARAAASLLRRCDCGLPAVIEVGPPWGPHIYMLPFRRFAFGSPAVIESSPPMGAQASRCVLRRGGPSAAWEASSPCPHRGFLTRRIDYFRALVPSLANTRKLETPHSQAHSCDALPQGRHRRGISPLCVTNRPQFPAENRPWMGNSIPWIGESMGWKWISMGWIDGAAAGIHKKAPWRRGKISKTRRSVAVRFNTVPYSAQGFGAGRGAGDEKSVSAGPAGGNAGGRRQGGAPRGYFRRKGSRRT